jgi:hypothetical protein
MLQDAADGRFETGAGMLVTLMCEWVDLQQSPL